MGQQMGDFSCLTFSFFHIILRFCSTHGQVFFLSKLLRLCLRIIRLTLLSPEIIHAIIAGTLEKDIGIEQLKQAMPLMWDEQKKMFGME